MKIDIQKKHSVAVLRFWGRMVHGGGDVMLASRFADCLAAGDRLFVFDMTGVSYLDSPSVGEVIACFHRARKRGGLIKLVLRKNSKPYQVVITTCLYKVFGIYGDVLEAPASFAAPVRFDLAG